MEVLAASGIIGFVFFVIFLSRFLFSSRLLRNLYLSKGININPLFFRVHKYLILSGVFQLLLLCMNQNILRNYLWAHFAIINLSFFALKYNIQSIRQENET
jgi:hypothetical protein